MAPSAMKRNVDGCPDLEVIAAYLDGRLSERERADVTGHVAECETCYFVFTEAAQTRSQTPAQTVVESPAAVRIERRWWSRPALWASAAGLAAAAALVLALVPALRPFGERRSATMEALVAAVGSDRPFEPRLSGGFSYGPARAAVRGSLPVQPPDVRIAAATIEKQALNRDTPESLHELGVASLVTGDIVRAITVLENTVSRDPTANSLNDLAAAYLVRGMQERRPEDLSRALTLSGQALARRPGMREALFNRALALERLSMIDDARLAWTGYLAADAESGWAAEARNHLQQLERVTSGR